MNLENKVNPNIQKISISGIRQFDQEISKIPNIIKLTLGEPDFDTPEHIKKAAITAISQNKTHYSVVAGLLELRQAAVSYFRTKYGISYQAEDEILVTVGVSEGIAACLTTFLTNQDEVLIPTPAYALYEPTITLAGARTRYIDTKKDGFILKPENLKTALAAYPKAKAIILNYPSNPTGVTYSQDQIKEFADILSQRDILVISDEVYSELNYTNQPHTSIAKYLPDQTIVLNGLSKSHAMTGWRIGFILAPKQLITQIAKSHQYLVTAASTISQYAALEALTRGGDDPILMREEYRERRDFITQRLSHLGFQISRPDGAFYIFAKIPDTYSQESSKFLMDLAQKKQIAFIPGSAFGGIDDQDGYIRISYASSMENIKLAMDRLEDYLTEMARYDV